VTWTAERKRDAAIRAPMTRVVDRPDTRVIARDGWFQLVTPSSKEGLSGGNEIYLSTVGEGDAERAIDDAIATYHSCGLAVKWCVGHWTRPRDFGERLLRRGFERWGVRAMGIFTSAHVANAADARDATSVPILARLGFEEIFSYECYRLPP